MARYQTELGDDAKEVPTRLLIVQDEAGHQVQMEDEDMAMSFPHLIVRESICFLGTFLFLSILAFFFDAPLEGIADPLHTPNPAKAPWYFLGLQELLHYYPPLISGIILPGVIVGGLIVIPYFDVNLRREPMWEKDRTPKFLGVWLATLGITVLLETTSPYHVWSVLIPTWIMACLVTAPYFFGGRGRFLGFLSTRSLPFWIFTWFVVVAVVLTAIGVFFRGPGWAFTLPWRDGLYF